MEKSIHLIGVLEGDTRENGMETISKEIMAQNFSELLRNIKPQNPNKSQTR